MSYGVMMCGNCKRELHGVVGIEMEIPAYIKRLYQQIRDADILADPTLRAAADALRDMTALAMEAEHKQKCAYYSLQLDRCVGKVISCTPDWQAAAHKALMEVEESDG